MKVRDRHYKFGLVFFLTIFKHIYLFFNDERYSMKGSMALTHILWQQISHTLSGYSWDEFHGFGLAHTRLQHRHSVCEFLDGSKPSSATNYSTILKHVFGVSAKKKAV